MKPKGQSDILDAQQLERVLRTFDLRTHEGRRCFAIVLALYKLGVRKSELCSSNREDVVVYNQRWCLRVHRKKGGKDGYLAVDDELYAALLAYWETLPPGASEFSCAPSAGSTRHGRPLFLTSRRTWRRADGWPDGKPRRLTARSVDLIIIKAVETAGLTEEGFRITPHSLRATAATHLLRRGVDVVTVKRFLGHATLQSTLAYARTDPEMVAEAQKVLRVNVRVRPRVRRRT